MARAIASSPSESKSRAIIIAAVIFSALAALLLFLALQNRGGGGVSSEAAVTTDVVVAGQNIGTNTKLTASMLEVKAVPANEALAGVYSTTAALVGLPVRYPIQSGEQVTTAKVGLKAIEDENDLALVLEPGQRAVAVEATEVTAVGGLLLPGNSVDVIAVFGKDTGGVDKAVTVLQHVQVLGVAQEAQQPVPAGGDSGSDTGSTGLQGQRPNDVKRQPAARSVTLAVTPDQAQLLASLQSQDDVKIWLSLRPVDDSSDVQLNETNLLQFHSPTPSQ